MNDQYTQDALQRAAYEEYLYQHQQLQDMITRFIQANGRMNALRVVGMAAKATREKVVTNNPLKTIKDAYKSYQGVSF